LAQYEEAGGQEELSEPHILGIVQKAKKGTFAKSGTSKDTISEEGALVDAYFHTLSDASCWYTTLTRRLFIPWQVTRTDVLARSSTTYPSGLHISRETNIKMVADRVCPCLPMWDATKKKGFGLLKTRDMYKEDEGGDCELPLQLEFIV